MADETHWYREEASLIDKLRRAVHRRPTPSIPGYSDLRQFQRGGQGIVYLARQDSTGQTVAIKVLLDGAFASDETRRRFEREIDLAASLRHDGIVRIYDSGSTQDDRPYFVMEYIDGRPFDEHIQTLSIQERLRLLAEVADAVQHAHQKGVIHRDLKPSNIRIDTEGRPHVLDFGAARPVERKPGDTISGSGQLVGSLPWASPEHARGDPRLIDVRSDVYCLGVVAYQALTGEFPYDVGSSVFETLKTILHAEPQRPRSVQPRLDVDSEAVLLKALAKDPVQRYQSAGEFAEDLRRCVRGDPVSARRASRFEQARRFVRRNRVVSGTVATILLVSLVAAGVSTRFAIEAKEKQRQAQHAHGVSLLAAAEAALRAGDHATARQQLDEAPQDVREQWEWRHLENRLDASLGTIVDTPSVFQNAVAWCRIDGCLLASGGEDGILRVSARSATGWSSWEQVFQTDLDLTGRIHTTKVVHVRSGKRLVLAGGQQQSSGGSAQGLVRIWDFSNVDTPKEMMVPLRIPDGDVQDIDVNQDASLLAVVSHQSVGLWRLIDAGAILAHTLRIHSPQPRCAAFNDRGDRLATGGDDWTARIWDVSDPTSPSELAVLSGHSEDVKDVAFRPGADDILATASVDGTVRLWDVAASIQERAELGETAVGVTLDTLQADGAGFYTVDFTADGRLLAAAGVDRRVCIWELPDDRAVRNPTQRRSIWTRAGPNPRTDLYAHRGTIRSIAWGPGRELASASWDGTVRTWSADTPPSLPTLGGHHSSVHAVEFATTVNGRTLVISGSGDWGVRVWDARQCEGLANLLGHGEAVTDLAVAHQRHTLFSTGKDGRVRMWDLSVATAIAARGELPWDGEYEPLLSVAVEVQKEQWVAATGLAGTLFLWKLSGSSWVLHKRIPVVGECGNVVAIEPGGRHVVVGFGDRDVDGPSCARVWQLPDGDKLQDLPHDGPVTAAAFSPDGRFLVTGTHKGTLVVWRVTAGRFHRVQTHTAHPAGIDAIVFEPGSPRHLATAATDRTLRLWTLDDDNNLQIAAILRGHVESINDLAFSPDGTMLASGSTGFEGRDCVVKLWESPPSSAESRERARARIRATAQRREVQPIVDELMAEHGTATAVVEVLQESNMDDAVRAAAINLVRFQRTPPNWVHLACWPIVREPAVHSGAMDAYERVVLQMKDALVGLPARFETSGTMFLTLGTAYYRAGRNNNAEVTLREARSHLAEHRPDAQPACDAVIAMAMHQSGRHEDAGRAYTRGCEQVEDSYPTIGREHYPDRDVVDLLNEAEELLRSCPRCLSFLPQETAAVAPDEHR